jgi:hypothetical protein
MTAAMRVSPANTIRVVVVMGTRTIVLADSTPIRNSRIRRMVATDIRVQIRAPSGAPTATIGTAASQ